MCISFMDNVRNKISQVHADISIFDVLHSDKIEKDAE